MDQFACSLGSKDCAIYLDCESLEFEYIKGDLDSYEFLLINTNKSRELSDSAYNDRLNECADILQILIENKVCQKSLTELIGKNENDYEKYFGVKPTLYRRFKHVISENNRVLKFCEFYKNKEIHKLGPILSESHLSLKNDYQVSCKELDELYEFSKKDNRILGGLLAFQ
jgi:galactokinase